MNYLPMNVRWMKNLNCHIESLALGYRIDRKDVEECWRIFFDEARWMIPKKNRETEDDYMFRFEEIFYVEAIKAFNLEIYECNDCPEPVFFLDYVKDQLIFDLKEDLWYPAITVDERNYS